MPSDSHADAVLPRRDADIRHGPSVTRAERAVQHSATAGARWAGAPEPESPAAPSARTTQLSVAAADDGPRLTGRVVATALTSPSAAVTYREGREDGAG